MYCLQSKKNKNHDTYRGVALRQSWKSKRFHSFVCPKYNLIEDLVHHILSGCDVHDGLHRYDEFFHQVLMLLRAIAHWEASLHGMELVPSLDFCRGQRHRCAMTNTMESDLLNVGHDVMEVGIDEGAPSIDGIHGHIHCQLKGLQLHHQGWRS